MAQIKRMAAAQIDTTAGTHARCAAVNTDVVDGIVADLTAHKAEHPDADLVELLPVCEVFRDGERVLLADGFSVLEAASQLGIEALRVHVHEGDARQAYLFSCRANNKNSARRTRADKRAAVTWALRDEEYGKWSDELIGELVLVTPRHVWDVRDALGMIPSRVLGRDGRWTKYKRNKEAPDAKPTRTPRPATAVMRRLLTDEDHAFVAEVVDEARNADPDERDCEPDVAGRVAFAQCAIDRMIRALHESGVDIDALDTAAFSTIEALRTESRPVAPVLILSASTSDDDSEVDEDRARAAR